MVGKQKPVESEINLDEWVGFFQCVFELLGEFLVVFFSPLGPSLKYRNLISNRATGVDDGRGVDVQRDVGLGEP